MKFKPVHPRPMYIMAVCEIAMGILSLVSPSTMNAAMEQSFKLASSVYALAAIMCGILLLGRRSLLATIALSLPALLYILTSAIYAIEHPNISPAFLVLYIGFYAQMLYLYSMTDTQAQENRAGQDEESNG